MKEALVFQNIKGTTVRCQVCQRRCIIADGQVGFCLTKINHGGILYTLNYGVIQGLQVDPIEKKPLYHFHPGEMVPSIGSYGCNFRCKQCLNTWCSWGEPASSTLRGSALEKKISVYPPAELLQEIKKNGFGGIAFTYNEPTVWAEYVFDVAKLAKKEKLFTVYVTNGSWSKETLDIIGPYIDAANVDLKGFSVESYSKMDAFFGKIPQMLVYAQKKHHIFIEITTLLIPGINDNLNELAEMTRWIVKNLGPDTPWHLSQYDPSLAPDPEFKKIPYTLTEQLAQAAEIGRKEGLKYVYVWAPRSNYFQSETICPKCGNVVIRRIGYQIKIIGVDNKGGCQKCGEYLHIKLT